jgi:hypothetical protein
MNERASRLQQRNARAVKVVWIWAQAMVLAGLTATVLQTGLPRPITTTEETRDLLLWLVLLALSALVGAKLSRYGLGTAAVYYAASALAYMAALVWYGSGGIVWLRGVAVVFWLAALFFEGVAVQRIWRHTPGGR